MQKLALASMLTLAGCATTTTGKLALKPPIATFESQKTALALEGCLVDAISYAGVPTVVRSEGRTRLIHTAGGGARGEVAIVDIPDGRQIEVRSTDGIYVSRYMNRVKACL